MKKITWIWNQNGKKLNNIIFVRAGGEMGGVVRGASGQIAYIYSCCSGKAWTWTWTQMSSDGAHTYDSERLQWYLCFTVTATRKSKTNHIKCKEIVERSSSTKMKRRFIASRVFLLFTFIKYNFLFASHIFKSFRDSLWLCPLHFWIIWEFQLPGNATSNLPVPPKSHQPSSVSVNSLTSSLSSYGASSFD